VAVPIVLTGRRVAVAPCVPTAWRPGRPTSRRG